MEAEGEGNSNYWKVKTSVWWDMEECRLPEDGSCDPNSIATKIILVLGEKNYIGPVTIFAYGREIPKCVQEALSFSGITVFSSSVVSFTKILVDMLVWAVDNPAPANYLLISGDCNFTHALHQLRMRRYNILLAQPQNASASLATAAEIVWFWSSILAGGSSFTDGELFQPSSAEMSVAPHEFFNAVKRDTSSSGSTRSSNPSQTDFAPDKSFSQNNLPIQSTNFAPDSFFRKDTPSHDTHSDMISFEHPENVPQQKNREPKKKSVLESLESFKFVSGSFPGQDIPSSSSSSFDSQKKRFHSPASNTPGCPEPPEYVQGLIGIILLALHTLKCEKMIPTEANIMDCVHYGDSRHQIADVRIALNFALEQQMIVKLYVGAVEIYLGKNTHIWKCVDPMGGNPKQYSKDTWDEIRKCLSSPVGQFKMTASACRYEAATHLKNLCLNYLTLGDIFQIINMIIHIKKWIIVHPSGWQPIVITLQDNTSSI